MFEIKYSVKSIKEEIETLNKRIEDMKREYIEQCKECTQNYIVPVSMDDEYYNLIRKRDRLATMVYGLV